MYFVTYADLLQIWCNLLAYNSGNVKNKFRMFEYEVVYLNFVYYRLVTYFPSSFISDLLETEISIVKFEPKLKKIYLFE